MKKRIFNNVGGGGTLSSCRPRFWGYTLAEIVVVMLIIAVVVSVTIGITKAKLDNIVSYTYYNAYSTLRKISTEMLSDWDPSDEEYKQSRIDLDKRFVFNVSKDYRFFSTLVSHIPFGFRIPSDRVRAGNTATVYGCAADYKSYSFISTTTNRGTPGNYYPTLGRCIDSISNLTFGSALLGVNGDYKLCPGKYKGLLTYDGANPGCDNSCSDLTSCSAGDKDCSCGLWTDYFDVSCGALRSGDYAFFGQDETVHPTANVPILSSSGYYSFDAKVLSAQLMEGNVCKYQIECNDGYEFVSEGTKYGFPIGTCRLAEQKVTCWDGSRVDFASECPVKCWDGSTAKYSWLCPNQVTCWDGSFVHNQSECPPCKNKPSKIPCGLSWDENTCKLTGLETKCYSTGQILDKETCQCYVPCWDGSKVEYSFQCPDKVTCWDGSYAHSESECPACTKTCPSGYKLNESICSCDKLTACWDGSYAESITACPDKVICWDGSYAYNESSCPACTNKPDTIPCGQSWDESTCSVVGTVKTCPSGQHLNSSCSCVGDCPSTLACDEVCDYEHGVSHIPGYSRSCSDETYEWSEEQCKCIPSPRTLPRKGMNFCKLFERHANIMSGSEVCSGSVISNGTTNFADKSPDITLRNGLRVYNMHTDARAISDLANNTQGGSYDGVPNTNSYGYTVYVDIDGSRGDSQLWSDVYPFYITLSGKIIPAYDTSNPEQSGGDSVRHMQVSVENENYNSGRRSIKWLAKSVPFKEGACIAGYVGDSTPYCKNGTSYTQAVECTSNINSFCRVKQIQPVKFFF